MFFYNISKNLSSFIFVVFKKYCVLILMLHLQSFHLSLQVMKTSHMMINAYLDEGGYNMWIIVEYRYFLVILWLKVAVFLSFKFKLIFRDKFKKIKQLLKSTIQIWKLSNCSHNDRGYGSAKISISFIMGPSGGGVFFTSSTGT